MKKLCLYFIFIGLLLFISTSCSNIEHSFYSSIANPFEKDVQSKQSKSSILTMTEIEIIKRAADYLKSLGEKVGLKESEIILLNNQEKRLLCKGVNEEQVFYEGDYLEVKLYSNPTWEQNEDGVNWVVYLAESGNILGYDKINP